MIDSPPKATIDLVYDRECPVCDFYCRHAAVSEGSELKRIDARESGHLMTEITRAGLDIDQGMVLKKDGVLYYGSDAIHELAKLAPRRGAFNRLSRALFSNRRAAHLLYPVMRNGRNLLLKIMGKTRINNLGKPGHERF